MKDEIDLVYLVRAFLLKIKKYRVLISLILITLIVSSIFLHKNQKTSFSSNAIIKINFTEVKSSSLIEMLTLLDNSISSKDTNIISSIEALEIPLQNSNSILMIKPEAISGSTDIFKIKLIVSDVVDLELIERGIVDYLNKNEQISYDYKNKIYQFNQEINSINANLLKIDSLWEYKNQIESSDYGNILEVKHKMQKQKYLLENKLYNLKTPFTYLKPFTNGGVFSEKKGLGVYIFISIIIAISLTVLTIFTLEIIGKL